MSRPSLKDVAKAAGVHTATVHEILTRLIDDGFGDQDFASLIELEARASGMTLAPEHVDVDDGLSPVDELARQAHGRR